MDKNKKKEIVVSKSNEITLASSQLTKRGLEIIAELVPHRIHVPSDYPTIAEALDHAVGGDTIELAEGIYREELLITKPVELIGCKNEEVIIEAINPITIFAYEVNHGISKLRNITMKKVSTVERAIGIEIFEGVLDIEYCRFEGFKESPEYTKNTSDEISEDTLSCAIHLCNEKPKTKFLHCSFVDCARSIIMEDKSCVDFYNCSFTDSEILDFGLCKINSRFCVYRSCNFFIGDCTTFNSSYDTYLDIKNLFTINEPWVHAFSEAAWVATFSHATIIVEYLFERFIADLAPDKDPHIHFLDSIVLITYGFYSDIKPLKDIFPYGTQSNLGNKGFQVNLVDKGVLTYSNQNLINIPPFLLCQDPLLMIKNNIARLSPNSPAIKSASDGTNLGAWQGD